jgi:hypothetical protein
MSDDILAQILARLTGLERMEGLLLAEIVRSKGETMARMDRLQASLDGIREDLTVLGGANDHARRLGDNTRDELRSLADLVAAIQRAQLKHGTRLDDIERRIPRGD